MVTVLLADDTEVVRRIIRRVLEQEDQINVVGEADSFRQTIALSSQLKPQIVVLDLHMPDGKSFSPADVKAHLEQIGAKIIAISIFQDDEAQTTSKLLGSPLLDKMNLASELIPAILREGTLKAYGAGAS